MRLILTFILLHIVYCLMDKTSFIAWFPRRLETITFFALPGRWRTRRIPLGAATRTNETRNEIQDLRRARPEERDTRKRRHLCFNLGDLDKRPRCASWRSQNAQYWRRSPTRSQRTHSARPPAGPGPSRPAAGLMQPGVRRSGPRHQAPGNHRGEIRVGASLDVGRPLPAGGDRLGGPDVVTMTCECPAPPPPASRTGPAVPHDDSRGNCNE